MIRTLSLASPGDPAESSASTNHVGQRSAQSPLSDRVSDIPWSVGTSLIPAAILQQSAGRLLASDTRHARSRHNTSTHRDNSTDTVERVGLPHAVATALSPAPAVQQNRSVARHTEQKARPRQHPAVASPPKVLRFATFNINKLTLAKVPHLSSLFTSLGIDVVALSETQLSPADHMECASALADYGWSAAFRSRVGTAKSGAHAGGHGGVAILARTGLRIEPVTRTGDAARAAHNAGEDTLICNIRHGGARGGQLLMRATAVYLSPQLARNRQNETDDCAERLHALLEQLRQYDSSTVSLVGGDFNARVNHSLVGSGDSFRSTDVPNPSTTTHAAAFLGFLEEGNLAPVIGATDLLGRPAAPTNIGTRFVQDYFAAEGTTADGSSVVDYILAQPSLITPVRITAHGQTDAGSHHKRGDPLNTSHALLWAQVAIVVTGTSGSTWQRRYSNRLVIDLDAPESDAAHERYGAAYTEMMRTLQPPMWAAMRSAGMAVITSAIKSGATSDELLTARRALAATLNRRMASSIEGIARHHYTAVRNTHPAVSTCGPAMIAAPGSVAAEACKAALAAGNATTSPAAATVVAALPPTIVTAVVTHEVAPDAAPISDSKDHTVVTATSSETAAATVDRILVTALAEIADGVAHAMARIAAPTASRILSDERAAAVLAASSTAVDAVTATATMARAQIAAHTPPSEGGGAVDIVAPALSVPLRQGPPVVASGAILAPPSATELSSWVTTDLHSESVLHNAHATLSPREMRAKRALRGSAEAAITSAPTGGATTSWSTALAVARTTHLASISAVKLAKTELAALAATLQETPEAVAQAAASQSALAMAVTAEAAARVRLRRATHKAKVHEMTLSGTRGVRGVWKRVLSQFNRQHEDGIYTAGNDISGGSSIPAVFADMPNVPAIDAVAAESSTLYAARTGEPLTGPAMYARGTPQQVPHVGHRITCPPGRKPVNSSGMFSVDEIRRVVFAEFPDRDDWGNQVHGAEDTSGLLGNTPPSVYTASLKRNKSPGLGGLTDDLLVRVGRDNLETGEYSRRREIIASALTGFFSAFLGLGALPAAWRAAALFPITKSGEAPLGPRNLRNITVQPLLGKVWGLLLYARVAHWAETQGVLSHCQYGFRQGRCTEQAIFSLTAMLGHYKHTRNKAAYVAFVDFKKAYDMVDRDSLLAKLTAMGAGEDFVALAALSFENTTARVWLNGRASAPFDVQRGVAQGDPLSPILFALFIDDLLRELDESPSGGLETGISSRSGQRAKVSCLAYADDISLMAASPEQLQHLLNIVQRWSIEWGMEINTKVGKTEVMVIPPIKPSPSAQVVSVWHVYGAKLNVTETYDYLGYVVTPSLDVELSLRRRLQRAWCAAQRAYALPRDLSARDLDIYIRSLVVPHLQYASAVWSPMTPADGCLYADYAPTRPSYARAGTRCPFRLAEQLHRNLARYLLRRTTGLRSGRLNIPTALLYAEAGWIPLASQWDAARLRLLGDIVSAPTASPLAAAGRVLASDYAGSRNASQPPASRAWNWVSATYELINRANNNATSGRERLDSHIDLRTLRPIGLRRPLVATWRSLVREVIRGPRGLLEREWRMRVDQDDTEIGRYHATVRLAVADPPTVQLPTYFDLTCTAPVSPHGPRLSTRHALAAYMASLAYGRVAAEFDRHSMPAYREIHMGNVAVEQLRLELRTASMVYDGAAVDLASAPSGAGGLLWGSPTCQTCHGGVTADAMHYIAECPQHDGVRLACLAEATKRAKQGPKRLRHLAQSFADIVETRNTAAGRNFILLATLGVCVKDVAKQRALPPCWAECLEGPGRTREGARHIGAASMITFRAFEPLVRAVAKAQPHAPAEVHASQIGVGRMDACEGQLPNSSAAVVGSTHSNGEHGGRLRDVSHIAVHQEALVRPHGRLLTVAEVAAAMSRRPISVRPTAVQAYAAPNTSTITRLPPWEPQCISIGIADVRPTPSEVRARENDEDEEFGARDPRRLNFRRAWSSGNDEVVNPLVKGMWDTLEFRGFVWNNADGRGSNLFELVGTRDLLRQFDPDIPADSGRFVSG